MYVNSLHAFRDFADVIRRDEVEAAFRKKYDLGDLYTFGSPRTSLSPFYDKVNGRTLKVQGGGRYVFRIVNNGDMVAEVPQRMPWRYTHVGGGWKLTKQGAQKMDDEVGTQWTLPPMVMNPSQLLDPSTFMDPNEWLIDHDPRKYYARWKSIPIPTTR
ncbi:hypothetical protein BD413DRAFT_563779 [Trametes elegans]|nr:hypothetical protein BD413DRAFT_563779 [Trametes elegans]